MSKGTSWSAGRRRTSKPAATAARAIPAARRLQSSSSLTRLRDRLLNQRSFGEIYDVLKTKGYRTMWEKGLDMAVKGQIELGELIHVVGKE